MTQSKRNLCRRNGSVVVVFGVLIVLASLGAGSLLLTTGMNKKDQVFAIRENALEAARAAAEEAALLVNNGAINVALDTSMSESVAPIPVESVMVNDATLDFMGIPKGNKPKVWVRASVVSQDMLPKKPPLAQLQAIKDEIDARGYVGKTASDLQEFWARVDGTNTVFGMSDEERKKGKTEGIKDDNPTNRFFSRASGGSVKAWGPRNRIKPAKTDPVTGDILEPEEIVSDNKLKGLYEVFKLFYDDGPDGLSKNKVGVPGVGALKPVWAKAMQSVGRDAASRMESCGSNPNLAMSHLIGDVQTGKKIASGTEVQITSDYMKLPDTLLANRTYLLEISAEMPYGDPSKPTEAGKVAKYTTYRLFQKSEWEMAIEKMTIAMVQSLRAEGVGVAGIQAMFPAETGVQGRDELIPGTTASYDPKKVVWDEVTKELPGMVGAKMYPYTVANAYPQRAY